MEIKRGSRRKPFLYIEPPANFSLRSNYERVASFFAHLRHQIYRDKIPSELPRAVAFEAFQRASPGAALVLAAELYRWQQFIGRKLRVIRHRLWNPEMDYLFRNLGLFDFLETPDMPVVGRPAEEPQIRILKYRSDTDVVGAKCDDLLEHLAEISGPIHADNFIYDGLIEALKNSKQHAYSEPDEWFGVPAGTWFMSGSYDRASQSLTAAVYDMGVGIPRTLPRATVWEGVRSAIAALGGGTDDGQMIKAAMEYGRTRTMAQGRGNGLPTMMRILDHHHGYLRIISGTGEAIYDSVNGVISTANHKVALGGTLIEWSISK
ncbi:MAG: hypothetical protein E5X23_06595 [Mesorhizobium sp.]|uniref:hypothetical protein n=1 Tax=Mesorhizobium sp. TaxID=1871066 RepID=UPI000FE65216|nr:hypothetical protein [Mesorhizobium sp.]RWG71419.1 MAG: hypothetical protein EOQ67_07310 [Mesorhizobium sp.]RWH63509.1 MAG: hypothetical protein EOQ81_04420 [Mesorhizobium sp.]TJV84517.1 MAG: hypothetical protein E5X23_06595 [Mesorhizobium sp.]